MSGSGRWRVVVHARDGSTSSEGFDGEESARVALAAWDTARVDRAGTHVIHDAQGHPLCVIEGRDIRAVTLEEQR